MEKVGKASREMKMSEPISVVQNWLSYIPIRMQGTLLLGLRGDDSQSNYDIKKITRWMRGLVFVPGNPENATEFMTGIHQLPKIKEGEPIYKALDYCTVHYFSHLLHALQVIAYHHPRREVSDAAFILYGGLCDKLHVSPENPTKFNERLKQLYFPGRMQPKDFEEAEHLLRRNSDPTTQEKS